MERRIISVSELNGVVKLLLDNEPLLRNLAVRGELSNYKIYPSGHHYFTLKDPEGALRCVMFKGQALRLRFRPENGMKVVVTGRVSVFPRDGAYQLYAEEMIPEGAGDLAVAFEQLKARLHAEGLFERERKKPLPEHPERIAVITSPAGAAVHDMIRIGDVIITGRGGGSLEDLWAFNDERVARAIFACETPVISAVGHEPDVTISDFVADARASTPSNAAEIAVPDQMELRRFLLSTQQRLAKSQEKRLAAERQRLTDLAAKRCLTEPMAFAQDKRMELLHRQQRLGDLMQGQLARKQQRFGALSAALDAMSPLKVLGRGYAVARNEAGGILKTYRDVAAGDAVTVTLGEGGFTARVERPFGKERKHGGKTEL